MLTSALLIAAIGASPDHGVLQGLSPELDAFAERDIKLHPDKFSIFASDFRRADKAKLRVYSSVHSSNESLHEAVNSEVLAGMTLKPPPDSPVWQRVHSSPSGNPLGDLLWKFEDTNSKSIRLRVGAGTVYVDAYLSYYGVRTIGRVTWEVQDHAADRVLVEDLVRRIVGRTLAHERFAKVRNGTLPTNATEVTDVTGKLFTSLPHWTSSQSLVTTQERRVGLRFTYHGKSVQVWTGTDKIKVGSEWKSIGAYVVEINNKLFVPKSGFLAALP